jgi:hypothetical protein
MNYTKHKKPVLFYILVIIFTILVSKTIEIYTGFPFEYFDTWSLLGNLLHIAMFILIFMTFYFLIDKTGLIKGSVKNE